MSVVRVGINGFGRIGRCALKHLVERDGFQPVGINDLASLDDLAYLLKYDSVHGWYPRKVDVDDGSILVDDERIAFSSERDPSKIPWGELGADVVIESTGAFRARAARHRPREAAVLRKSLADSPSEYRCAVRARRRAPRGHTASARGLTAAARRPTARRRYAREYAN